MTLKLAKIKRFNKRNIVDCEKKILRKQKEQEDSIYTLIKNK